MADKIALTEKDHFKIEAALEVGFQLDPDHDEDDDSDGGRYFATGRQIAALVDLVLRPRPEKPPPIRPIHTRRIMREALGFGMPLLPTQQAIVDHLSAYPSIALVADACQPIGLAE